MLLTPHFSDTELCTTNKKKYQEMNLQKGLKQIGKLYMLAGFAERVREIVGKPLIITSGFRCEELNKAVGGAFNSQHKLCEAIDFVSKGLTTSQIACKLASSDLKFQQLIVESSKGDYWIHVSIGSKREVLQYKDGKYTALGNV